MYRELICLTICFLVGILLFYFINQSCYCNIMEGVVDGQAPLAENAQIENV